MGVLRAESLRGACAESWHDVRRASWRDLVQGPLRLVPGTLLVTFLLATGRWGSYVGLPSHSVYVTDVALAVTVAWVLLRSPGLAPGVLPRLVPVLCLSALALVRFAVGSDHSLVALRDLVPYAYALVCLAAAVRTGAEARRRSTKVLLAGLVVHGAWVMASTVVPDLSDRLPAVYGEVRLLLVRPDFDGAVMAVCTGLLTTAAVRSRGGRRAAASVLALTSVALVLQMANRAAMLAVAVAMLVTVLAGPGFLRALVRPRAVGVAAVLLLGAAVLVPQTNLYERLTGSPAYEGNDASATRDAREGAWEDVLDYVDDDRRRVLVGTGFGPDYVWISGAALRLQGQQGATVRSPHDYPLNTYARMGLTGLAALAWVVLAGASAVRTVLRWCTVPVDRLLPVLVCTTLFVVSLLGVILESPFGAVPFFWCLGLVLADPGIRMRAHQPAPV